jgi:hypothetical protein
MKPLALATVFVGFALIAAAVAGTGFRHGWIGYLGLAVAAAGMAALIYFG